MHIGALRKEAGRDFGLVHIFLPNPQEPVNEHTFSFELDRQRLRRTLRREGRYLLRSNMQAASPETVWESYLLLTRIEQAFKDLKGELSIRPIWRQLETCPRENGEENRSSYFCFLFGLLSPHNVAKSCAGTSRRTYVRCDPRMNLSGTVEHSND